MTNDEPQRRGGAMSARLSDSHLQRGAVVYVRQSSMGQVREHTESKRRQYALADKAREMGFERVETIDEDQGRSGSGSIERSGFNRLAGMVCSGNVGAVICLEASRLARNGREWHQLIDLCAICGTLLIDGDAVYDPKLSNDRLMLGVKGTVAEYELSVLRQRALAARDSKAQRGELRMLLPPGYCWNDTGRIEIDPDEHVVTMVRTMFRKFRELCSARQVLLWLLAESLMVPVMRQGNRGAYVEWVKPRYYNVVGMIRNPIYAGSYAFGRTEVRTRIENGRARRTEGHAKPRENWSVLLHRNHTGYITWEQYEEHRKMLTENAHSQPGAQRKSGRGGQALLSGLIRCGRCARMLRVAYTARHASTHRYECRGDEDRKRRKACVAAGGLQIDAAVCELLLEALSPMAIEAAALAADRAARTVGDVLAALARELEAAKYEAQLAARRHSVVDPERRLVARELEARWECTLDRVREIESRIATAQASAAKQPAVDRTRLVALASDLRSVWNSDGTEMRTKQRLVHTVIREVVLDLDDEAREYVVVIHWTGGQHSAVRVARKHATRFPDASQRTAVDVIRQLAADCTDREIALTLTRMRCARDDEATWTIAGVAKLRERLELPPFDPASRRLASVSIEEAARRLSVSIATVRKMIAEGVLRGAQQMPLAPWRIDVASLESDAVKIGARRAKGRRLSNSSADRDARTLKLPGC